MAIHRLQRAGAPWIATVDIRHPRLVMKKGVGLLIRQALPFALAIGIWLAPVPAGLTAPAWHLFAIFVAAIVAVLDGAFPLLTSTMLAAGAVVLTGNLSPPKAFSGFSNTNVLL